MEQEVFKLKSQLVKTSLPDSSILEILNRLAEFKQMPIKVLSKTEIGITVGKFRKHENVKISSAAKSLIKLWKKQLETASEDSAPKEPELPKISHSESTPVPVPAAPKTFTMPSTRTVKTDNVKVPQKSDRIREKSIEMLYTALASNTDVDSSKVLQKAVEAEEECFSQFGSECSEAYRDRIRTLFLNLKDKSNPELKLRILSGSLEVSIFCVMTPEEMKSKERQEEEEKLREENLFKARGAQPQEAETDMFKCGKCKQRKCRYYQMQTRSADEPMTTFVTCTNCGNKWKFC